METAELIEKTYLYYHPDGGEILHYRPGYEPWETHPEKRANKKSERYTTQDAKRKEQKKSD